MFSKKIIEAGRAYIFGREIDARIGVESYDTERSDEFTQVCNGIENAKAVLAHVRIVSADVIRLLDLSQVCDCGTCEWCMRDAEKYWGIWENDALKMFDDEIYVSLAGGNASSREHVDHYLDFDLIG
jgi:hypothetical protein